MIGAAAREPPRMVVLAGPNGSGKSTVTNGLRNSPDFPKLYVNADDIARNDLAHVADQPARELRAAQLADQRRQAAVQNGESFAFGTVLSTPAKVTLIDEARAKGFVVDLIFVTTDDADINIVRVENRIQQGGHPVQPEKIRERYERAMALLPVALLKADNCFVFDNSVDGQAASRGRPGWQVTTRCVVTQQSEI